MDNKNQGVLTKIGVLIAGAAFNVAAQAAEPPQQTPPLPDMTHFAAAYKDAVIIPRVAKIPLCDKLEAPIASDTKFRITVAESAEGGRVTFHGSKFRFRQEF